MKQFHSISGLVTAISLLLSVIWLSPALAVAAPTFVSLGQLKAEGLRVPGAMDLDEAGNLYVADARGGKVHKFSPYGLLLQSFDLQATGRGLAVTPDGERLYLSRLHEVVIVDAGNGEVLGSLSGAEATGTEFKVAGEVDLDVAGNVFVMDNSSMQVKIYDASGQFQSRFGGAGKLAGQFMEIGGMAINNVGQVVVADSSFENGMVHVFSLDSSLNVVNVVTYLKSSAANFGAPIMHDPRGLTFDGQGRAYFLEFQSSQVRVTDAGFTNPGAYANPGYAVGQLNNVIDTIFDQANSRLFVGCDTGRIEIFGINGGSNPVDVNHAPTTPAQQSPVAGSEVASSSPALVIQNASDADGDALTYTVILSQGEEVVLEMSVPAATGETTTAVVSTELAENAAFSWTVQASDGKDVSAVSAAANFVVNAVEEAPSTPELSAPANGTSIDGLDTISWTESTDPDPNDLNISYQVEVALDEAFGQVVAAESLTTTELALGALTAYGDLVDGTTYFWRVTAQDDTLMSAPSAAGQFVYDTTALTITANMPDAVVSFSGNHAFSGQMIGVAPVELRDFASGTLSVVVERAGFEPSVTTVTLAEGDNVDLYAALVPAMNVENLSVRRRGINGRSGLFVGDSAVPFLVDFDSDGDLDMLVGDGSGQITLFANMQVSGSNKLYFDNGVSLGLSVMPGAVPFVADWNNDGRKDLIVGQADGSVKLFINVGLEESPAFAGGVDLQTVNGALDAGNSSAPAVLDYNGDGAKDLLVGNASGEVLVFLNQASDMAPLLAAPFVALQVGGAVVPCPVDWDADGQKELMLTAKGVVTLYTLVDGEYQAGQTFSERRSQYFGAFPIDLDGSGKQLLVGQSNGEIVYLAGNSTNPVAAFPLALQDKIDELGGFVAEAAPELLSEVTALSALISAGDYAGAALAADELALSLANGAAQTSALELADLCK